MITFDKAVQAAKRHLHIAADEELEPTLINQEGDVFRVWIRRKGSSLSQYVVVSAKSGSVQENMR